MFIKKYLLLFILPLLLSGESIVGKWEMNAQKTEQSIAKLSIKEDFKKILILLSSKGFRLLECYKDKTCIQNTITNIDICMGHFHWEQNNNNYTLTPYTNKLCPDAILGEDKKVKITIANNKLKFPIQESSYFIYNKISSTTSKKPLNYLTKIKYNKIYKSKAVDTYDISSSSTVPTYFYLFFTNKNNFHSVVTTQSNISSIDELRNIIQKKSEESKLSAKEQLNKLKNMPYTDDNDIIAFTNIYDGTFNSNKNGISGYFNGYNKISDVKTSSDKNSFGFSFKVSFKDRICEQITFMPNNILSCNNGVKYTLLDKNSPVEKQTIQKASRPITKGYTANIDIEAKRREENGKSEKELQDAINDVM